MADNKTQEPSYDEKVFKTLNDNLDSWTYKNDVEGFKSAMSKDKEYAGKVFKTLNDNLSSWTYKNNADGFLSEFQKKKDGIFSNVGAENAGDTYVKGFGSGGKNSYGFGNENVVKLWDESNKADYDIEDDKLNTEELGLPTKKTTNKKGEEISDSVMEELGFPTEKGEGGSVLIPEIEQEELKSDYDENAPENKGKQFQPKEDLQRKQAKENYFNSPEFKADTYDEWKSSYRRPKDKDNPDAKYTAFEEAESFYKHYMESAEKGDKVKLEESKQKYKEGKDEKYNFQYESKVLGFGLEVVTDKLNELSEMEEVKAANEKIESNNGILESMKPELQKLSARIDYLKERAKTQEQINEVNDLIDVANQKTQEFEAVRQESLSMVNTPELQEYYSAHEDYKKFYGEYKNLEQKYPEVFKEMHEKQQNKKVADILYEADAPYLLAREKQLAKQLTGVITNTLEGLISIPRTLIANDEYGWTDATADWAETANNYFLDGVFGETATRLEAPMYLSEKDVADLEEQAPYINWEKGYQGNGVMGIRGATTMADMFVLLYGGRGIQQGINRAAKYAVPTAAGVSYETGLFASSWVKTHNDYYKHATQAGLSPQAASMFSMSSASVTSFLERINPQKYLVGAAGRRSLTVKQVADALKRGGNWKKSFVAGINFELKEVGGENFQEMTQLAGDMALEKMTNTVMGKETFGSVGVDEIKNEIKETIALTTLVSAIPGLGGAVSQGSKLYRDAVFEAANNFEYYSKKLEENRENAKTKEDLIHTLKALEDIKLMKEAISVVKATGIKSEDAIHEAAWLTMQRAGLETSLKNAKSEEQKSLVQQQIDEVEAEISKIHSDEQIKIPPQYPPSEEGAGQPQAKETVVKIPKTKVSQETETEEVEETSVEEEVTKPVDSIIEENKDKTGLGGRISRNLERVKDLFGKKDKTTKDVVDIADNISGNVLSSPEVQSLIDQGVITKEEAEIAKSLEEGVDEKDGGTKAERVDSHPKVKGETKSLFSKLGIKPIKLNAKMLFRRTKEDSPEKAAKNITTFDEYYSQEKDKRNEAGNESVWTGRTLFTSQKDIGDAYGNTMTYIKPKNKNPLIVSQEDAKQILKEEGVEVNEEGFPININEATDVLNGKHGIDGIRHTFGGNAIAWFNPSENIEVIESVSKNQSYKPKENEQSGEQLSIEEGDRAEGKPKVQPEAAPKQETKEAPKSIREQKRQESVEKKFKERVESDEKISTALSEASRFKELKESAKQRIKNLKDGLAKRRAEKEFAKQERAERKARNRAKDREQKIYLEELGKSKIEAINAGEKPNGKLITVTGKARNSNTERTRRYLAEEIEIDGKKELIVWNAETDPKRKREVGNVIRKQDQFYGKAVAEYAKTKSNNWGKGKSYREDPDIINVSNPQQELEFAAEKSENPLELVQLYARARADLEAQAQLTDESPLVKLLDKIHPEDIKEYFDWNNIKDDNVIQSNWLIPKKERPGKKADLDDRIEQALGIDAVDATNPAVAEKIEQLKEQFLETIIKYPNGPNQAYNALVREPQPTPQMDMVAERFEELTGVPLSPQVLRELGKQPEFEGVESPVDVSGLYEELSEEQANNVIEALENIEVTPENINEDHLVFPLEAYGVTAEQVKAYWYENGTEKEKQQVLEELNTTEQSEDPDIPFQKATEPGTKPGTRSAKESQTIEKAIQIVRDRLGVEIVNDKKAFDKRLGELSSKSPTLLSKILWQKTPKKSPSGYGVKTKTKEAYNNWFNNLLGSNKKAQEHKRSIHSGRNPEKYVYQDSNAPLTKANQAKVKKEAKNAGIVLSDAMLAKPFGKLYEHIANEIGKKHYGLKSVDFSPAATQNSKEAQRGASVIALRSGIDGAEVDGGFIVYDETSVIADTNSAEPLFSIDKADIKGFVDPETGKIYLNPDLMTPDTPVHEAGHVFVQLIKAKHPQLYEAAKKALRGSVHQKAVVKAYPELTQDVNKKEQLWDEVIATFIGVATAEQIEQIENRSNWDKFKKLWTQLWNDIKRALYIPPRYNLASMTMEEFGQLVADEFTQDRYFKKAEIAELNNEKVVQLINGEYHGIEVGTGLLKNSKTPRLPEINTDKWDWNAMKNGLLDIFYNRQRRYIELVKSLGYDVDANNNFAQVYELAKSKWVQVQNEMKENVIESRVRGKMTLMEEYKRDGINTDTLSDLMVAMHMPERNKVLHERQEKKRQEAIDELQTESDRLVQKIAERELERPPKWESLNEKDSKVVKENDRFIEVIKRGNDRELNQLYKQNPNHKIFFSELYAFETEEDADGNVVGAEGGGMTNAESREVIERMKKNGEYEKYFEAAKKWRNTVIEPTLELMSSSGLISDKEFDSYSSKSPGGQWKFYVPMFVNEKSLDEQTVNSLPASNPSSRNAFSQARGSHKFKYVPSYKSAENQRMNVLAGSMLQFMKMTARMRENEARQSLLNFMERNPDSRFYTIKKSQVFPMYSESGDFLGMFDTAGSEMAKNEIGVRKDGQYYKIQILDKRLLEAIQGGNTLWVQALEKVFANKVSIAVTSFMRNMFTLYNPQFVVDNFVRDLQTAGINITATTNKTSLTKQFLETLIKEKPMRGIYAYERGRDKKTLSQNAEYWHDLYEELKRLGGLTSWQSLGNRQEDMVKLLDDASKPSPETNLEKAKEKSEKAWKGMLHWADSANAVSESTSRLVAYHVMLKNGVDKQTAAVAAKNLTVNFEKKGYLGNVLNSTWMFSNAAIQGTAIHLKNLYRSPATRKMVGSLMAANTALNMLNYFYSSGGDEEDYNEYINLPGYIKERNVILYNPTGSGPKMFTLPLAYGFNFFKVVSDVLFETAIGAIPMSEALVRVGASALGSYNPIGGSFRNLSDVSPTILKPPIELMANRNYLNSNIHKEAPPYGMRQLWSQRNYPNTAIGTKALEGFINEISGGSDIKDGWALNAFTNAEALEHLTTSYTGGVGKTLLNIGHVATSVASGELPELNRTPIIRSFFKNVPDFYYTEQLRQMWMSGNEVHSNRKIRTFEGLYKKIKKEELTENYDVLERMYDEYMDRQRLHQLEDGRKEEVGVTLTSLDAEYIKQKEDSTFDVFMDDNKRHMHIVLNGKEFISEDIEKSVEKQKKDPLVDISQDVPRVLFKVKNVDDARLLLRHLKKVEEL